MLVILIHGVKVGIQVHFVTQEYPSVSELFVEKLSFLK